jgi:signal peptidase
VSAAATAAGARRSRLKRFTDVLFAAAVLAALALAALLVVYPKARGYETYVITGKSMTGSISRGALIYSQPVPVGELRVGDVITFAPPGSSKPVTHRLIGIERSQSGEPVFRTQGDNVLSPDPWAMTPSTPTTPRYVAQIPYLGYVVAAFSLPVGRVLLILLPAVLVALGILRRVWVEAGEAVAREGGAS